MALGTEKQSANQPGVISRSFYLVNGDTLNKDQIGGYGRVRIFVTGAGAGATSLQTWFSDLATFVEFESVTVASGTWHEEIGPIMNLKVVNATVGFKVLVVCHKG